MSTFTDRLGDAAESLLDVSFGFTADDEVPGPEGEIFVEMTDPDTGEVLEERHLENVITRDYSILLARLAADNTEPRHGIFALAVGTGDVGWDPLNPPAEQDTQRSLHNEIERKPFSDVTFRDDSGAAVSYPTNVVDFETTFAENEAVGTLVEMGLLGGDVVEDMNASSPVTPPSGSYDDTVDLTGKDTLVNYKTFEAISKPASAIVKITWRITH